MRAKIRPILEECIHDGIWAGWQRAHKYTDEPTESNIMEDIENWIWLLIDERFEFDRSLASEISEGLDALKEQNAP